MDGITSFSLKSNINKILVLASPRSELYAVALSSQWLNMESLVINPISPITKHNALMKRLNNGVDESLRKSMKVWVGYKLIEESIN